LDRELLAQFVKAGTLVVTVEENQLAGGFGSAVVEAMEEIGVAADVKRLGIPESFIPHATQAQQRQALGLDEDGLLASLREHAGGKGEVVPRAAGWARGALPPPVEAAVVPRGRVLEGLEMRRHSAAGQRRGDVALDLLAEIVAPSDGPRAGYDNVHLDETARPGGARADAVNDDAALVESLEEAREGGL